MAATQFATGTVLGGTSISASLSGVASGALLTLQLSYYFNAGGGGQAAPSAPAGWTTAYAPNTVLYSGSGAVGVAVYIRSGAPSGSHSPSVSLPATSYGFITLSEFAPGTYPDPVTVDQTAVNSQSNVINITAWDTGTTATTTQANELVLVQVDGDEGSGSANIGLTTPPATGYTQTNYNADATANEQGAHGYKEVSSTGTQTASWTKNAYAATDQAWMATVVTLKGFAGGAPTIDVQPTDQAVASGGTAVYAVSATASGGSLTYQWQDNRTGAFANCSDGSGATSASYTTAATGQSGQGRLHRCVVTDSNGSVNTRDASLGVQGFPVYLWSTAVQSGADVWLRDPLLFSAAGGGAVGLASETDTALGLGSARPAGRADETDSAFALAAVAIRAVGLATETDTALPLSGAQLRAAGLSTETDTALTLAGVQLRTTGLAAETDAALTLAGVQLRVVGLSTETDTAFALSAGAGSPVGRADETDTAFALAGVQRRAAGLAAETDTALALTAVSVRAVGLSTETDTALPLAALQLQAVGLATETDTAFALQAGGALPVGLAVETDTAFALLPGAAPSPSLGGRNKRDITRLWRERPGVVSAPVGLAVERDRAFALDGKTFAAFGARLRAAEHYKAPRTVENGAREAESIPKAPERRAVAPLVLTRTAPPMRLHRTEQEVKRLARIRELEAELSRLRR